MNRLQRLQDAGVSIWLDTLSRELLETGAFAALVDEFAVTGATSNPTIFAKAITGSDRYDAQLRTLASRPATIFRSCSSPSRSKTCAAPPKCCCPCIAAPRGDDGYVSFECTPDVADDADATIAQALDLWQRLDLPNVLIKVPATQAGVSVIEALTARGVNVNVTLLFSVERYEEVIEAYLRGLEHRIAAGDPVDEITSVASFFVSRIDTKADAMLAPTRRRGVASRSPTRTTPTGATWRASRGERWGRLQQHGARPQRPLWASTGTKDPGYSDVLYVERLIAPGVINTMPENDPARVRRPRQVGEPLGPDLSAADAVLSQAAAEGVDLETITGELEREGVQSFCDAYDQLLRCIESKLGSFAMP